MDGIRNRHIGSYWTQKEGGMTLIEYIQNVPKPHARVVIFRIFAVLCVCTLLDTLIYDALTGRASTNGFLTLLTGYLAWMVHKDNFKKVYMIAAICFAFNAVSFLLLILLAYNHGTNWLRFNDEAMFLYSVSHLTIFRAATFSFNTTLSAIFVAALGFGIISVMAKRFRDEAQNTVVSESSGPNTHRNPNYTSLLAKKDTIKTSSRIESDQKVENTHRQENQTSKTMKHPIERSKKEERSEIMDDLEKRYRKGRLAIQFREDAKKGWETIEKLPVHLKLEYLKWLSDDPKREVKSIVVRLVEDHRKTIEPFSEEVLNNCYSELRSLSAEAAAEFKDIVETLGDTIDPIKVKGIISNRRGKVGKRLIEYQSSLQRSLMHKWLPDAHFQHLFSDEFKEFVQINSLDQTNQNEAWCLFIQDLYKRCEWAPPSRSK